MMRKRAVIFAICLLLPCVGHAQRRGVDTKGNPVKVAGCKRCVLLTDISQHRIAIADLDRQRIIWEWKSSESGIPAGKLQWFKNYSDVKPVYGKKYLLVSSSAGGVALVRIADKKAVFFSYAGGSTHSIALLPDGNMISASSTGNFLMVFHVDTVQCPDVYKKRIYLHGAHNVVWDKKRNVLWAAGKTRLYRFRYNFNCRNPDLSPVDSVDLPGPGAHDLFPVYGKDSLFLTTIGGMYLMDPATKKIVPLVQPQVKNIKSVSSGPEGFPILIMQPKVKWWSDEVLDLKGDRVFQQTGLKIYKARWFLSNRFSYPDEDIRVCAIKQETKN
jgi:hypothetical protein